MLDLETLGTTADAAIMSIGAVKFDLESGEIDDNGFYASVSIDSNLEHKRRISEDTLIWWMQQSKEAQKVFFEAKQTLGSALESFTDWFGGNDDAIIWSNGADFDIPMMAHAMKQLGVETPWKFYNSRCVRTYKNLPCAKKVPRPTAGVAHNALHDAMNQVLHVQAIHQLLIHGKVTA